MGRRSTGALFVGTLTLVLLVAQAGGQGPLPGLPSIPNPKVIRAGKIGRAGGTLVFSSISDPRTFNPIVAQETSSSTATGYIFEGLVETNFDTTEVEPALAESWTVSKDGRIWTFKLRRGVKFTDGVELTADDVVFTLQAIFTEGVQTSYRDVLTLADKPIKWRKIDTYTVEFRTDEPFGPFLREIGFEILPKHKLESALKAGGTEFNKTWGVNTPPQEIVGTGPFTLQSYVPGQRLVYLRNPNYWKVDARGNRLPYLTRAVISIVPNLDVSRLQFQAGETDIYGVRPREFADFKGGEGRGNYTVYEIGPAAGIEFLVFNQNPRGVKDPKLSWFTNLKFRQAISHAIDRTTIANQVYAGRAKPQFGPLTIADKFFYNPNVKQYPYDPSRSDALLGEAGFKKGADGVLRDSQGRAVEFTLSTNADNNDRVAIGNLIREDLTKLGIKVNFAPEAFNTLVGKLTGSFNWEAIVIALTGSIDPHGGQNVWKSSGSLHMWAPEQEKAATAWEVEIDRIYDQAATTVDQNKRKQLYNRWQEIAAEQQPFIYLTNTLTSTAVRNTLDNIRPRPFGGSLWNVEQVFYKTPFR